VLPLIRTAATVILVDILMTDAGMAAVDARWIAETYLTSWPNGPWYAVAFPRWLHRRRAAPPVRRAAPTSAPVAGPAIL